VLHLGNGHTGGIIYETSSVDRVDTVCLCFAAGRGTQSANVALGSRARCGRRGPVLGIDGRLVAGATSGGKLAGEPPKGPQSPFWLGPEGPHAVENVGPHDFRAIRVEIKDAAAAVR
jgi:hypothetical protein